MRRRAIGPLSVCWPQAFFTFTFRWVCGVFSLEEIFEKKEIEWRRLGVVLASTERLISWHAPLVSRIVRCAGSDTG